VLEAVLFDWGDAIGHPASPELTARFREAYAPMLWAPGVVEEIEYPGLVRRLLAEVDLHVSDDELALFLEAEHAAWGPARQLAATTHALLDALRGLGLKLGLVSNAIDPPWLLHRDLADLGVAQRLDAAVFSSEVGMRKPHRLIFETALERLDVRAAAAVFVGDMLYQDIRGASELGMTTVQALWFRADHNPDGAEPDYQAFTQMDVLNVARRLRPEA
jgi:putative hydrolase of the HAD superfamily